MEELEAPEAQDRSASSSTRSRRRASSTASSTRASSTTTSTTRSAARRVLDRIVGYDVSALVWSKLAFGLSAGRVQSVALRLIVDREREIEAFVPEEYWNVGVGLVGKKRAELRRPAGHRATARSSRSTDGEHGRRRCEPTSKARTLLGRQDHPPRAEAQARPPRTPLEAPAGRDQLPALHHQAHDADRAGALRRRRPRQGDGGPVGLITYMRTDSLRVSDDAIQEVRAHIARRYGEDHLPEKPNVYKAKKNAQEAHEAIRPTSLDFPPDAVQKYLKDEQFKLYKLIWERFVASQMAPAVYDQTSVDIEAKLQGNGAAHTTYGLRASGRVLKFGGWLEAYGKGARRAARRRGRERRRRRSGRRRRRRRDGSANGERPQGRAGPARALSLEEMTEASLPELAEGEVLTHGRRRPACSPSRSSRQPPARYNEGSLVRELEKRGIGRPSTYAEIISKVQARDYVEKVPSGGVQADDARQVRGRRLVKSSLDFMDPNFTAKMEEELDEVEAGKLGRVALLKQVLQALPRAARQVQEAEALGARAGGDRQHLQRVRQRRCSSAGAGTAGSSAASATPSARTRRTSGRTAGHHAGAACA